MDSFAVAGGPLLNPLMDEVEQLRDVGLRVVTAIALVAERHALAATVLADVHFAWLMDSAGLKNAELFMMPVWPPLPTTSQ